MKWMEMNRKTSPFLSKMLWNEFNYSEMTELNQNLNRRIIVDNFYLVKGSKSVEMNRKSQLWLKHKKGLAHKKNYIKNRCRGRRCPLARCWLHQCLFSYQLHSQDKSQDQTFFYRKNKNKTPSSHFIRNTTHVRPFSQVGSSLSVLISWFDHFVLQVDAWTPLPLFNMVSGGNFALEGYDQHNISSTT